MSVEQKNGSVVFKVVVLEGMLPESFKNSSLFIDFGDACGGDAPY